MVGPIQILNTESYELVYHVQDKIVHHTLKPPMDDDDTRDTLNGQPVTKWQKLLTVGTDLLIEHGATKWVADNRVLQKPVNDVDNEWIQEVWQHRAVAAGWKYWALVVPTSLIGQADMVSYVETNYEKGIWVTVFKSVEEAFEWIRGVDSD